MKDTDTTRGKFVGQLIETCERVNDFLAPRWYRKDGQLSDTEQAAQQEIDNIDPNDARVKGLLYQSARDKTKLLKFNTKALIFVYVILITLIALTLQGANTLILALAAILGLFTFWLFTWLQVRKLEKQFYQQEMRNYMGLSSSEPLNDFNEVKTLDSGSSVTLPLTQRELEIITQMAGGKINKEIACSLGITENTVKNHISHIFLKLDVTDRTSAVLLALRHDWLKGDHLEQLKHALK